MAEPATAELDALKAQIRDQARPIVLTELAKRAGVNDRWLRHFLAGDIPEPGYAKVRRLQRAVKALRARAPRVETERPALPA